MLSDPYHFGARQQDFPCRDSSGRSTDVKPDTGEEALLLSELRHRYKNNLQTIRSFLHLKALHTQDAEVRHDLNDVEMYITILSGVDGELLVCDERNPILLGDYLRRLVEKLKDVFENAGGAAAIRLELRSSFQIPVKAAAIVGLIVNEAITNSFKHAVPRGATRIDLTLSEDDRGVILSISDDGPGCAPQEQPRRSGMVLMERLAGWVGAELALDPKWVGTRYVLRLPLKPIGEEWESGRALHKSDGKIMQGYETGHWQEFSDSRGIDTKYMEERANAERELAEAIAGPDNWDTIAPDDVEIKNPGGEFQSPSALHVGSAEAPAAAQQRGMAH